MKELSRSKIAAAAAALFTCASASALDINAGDYKFSVNGNINVHYIHTDCDDSNPVTIGGGLTCVKGSNQSGSSSSVSNGLLPAALTFGVATTQNGFDIGAHFGLYPGVSTNDGGSPNLSGGNNTALGTTGLDVRQVYMTFGNKDMGTVLMGRNFGLFGFDSIINDMTLPGVGGPGGSASGAPSNTTLGGIGLGYLYCDTLAQINYTTPSFAGATLTAGIYDPLNALGGATGRKSQPGLHGKLAWGGSLAGAKISLSSSFLTQQQRDNAAGVDNYRSYGVDFGGKVDIADLEVLGWYYYGKGLGTTALFLLSSDGAGHRRGSEGYIAQATYKFGALKLGANYGVSRLNQAQGENATGLVRANSKITGGAYYALTKNLTVLTEVSSVISKAHVGGKNESLTFNIGTFLSF